MKIVAILQARMGSTRLPGKVLLPLAGETMLDNIWARVMRASRIDRLVVAIPKSDFNAMRVTRIPFLDWFLYDGDECDLVGRYLAAATQHDADLIVRIPCDNPCIDPEYIDQAITRYLKAPTVFFSNTTDRCGDYWVDGIGAEVFSVNRLQWLDQITQGHPDWREHPHLYFRDHGLGWLPKADIRLDVNTQADFDFLRDIYDHFGHHRFTTEDVVTYLVTKGVRTHG